MTTFVIFMFWLELFAGIIALVVLRNKPFWDTLLIFLGNSAICLWAAYILGWIG